MRNPLNDIRLYAAVCAGAGGAFGLSACVTLGTDNAEFFAKLSGILLIASAITYAVLRLVSGLETDENAQKNTRLGCDETGVQNVDCDDASQNHTFIITEIHGIVKDGEEK